MVSIKQAVTNAVTFAQDLMGSQQTQGIRLEEVDGDAKSWFITLSIPNSDDSFQAVLGGTQARHFKKLTVNKETGEVLNMKIRELANK
jgi:hypothetical protein